VEQKTATCHRPANMATQTIKGMYVKNEITAITRQRNRHDLASVSYCELVPRSLRKYFNQTHQTRFAGRPAAPPFLYQSLQQPASVAHATRRRSTKAGRARGRRKTATRVRMILPPPPCESAVPSQSPYAVGGDGDPACDMRTTHGRWTVLVVSRAR
jgi:hypothetical protein